MILADSIVSCRGLLQTKHTSRWERCVADDRIDGLLLALDRTARVTLAQLPTPMHRLENLGRRLSLPGLWIKRDDLTGLEGGGQQDSQTGVPGR